MPIATQFPMYYATGRPMTMMQANFTLLTMKKQVTPSSLCPLILTSVEWQSCRCHLDLVCFMLSSWWGRGHLYSMTLCPYSYGHVDNDKWPPPDNDVLGHDNSPQPALKNPVEPPAKPTVPQKPTDYACSKLATMRQVTVQWGHMLNDPYLLVLQHSLINLAHSR